jgi:hypothetical protein
MNPSIHESINPSIHQSINPSIHQSINPSIHQSMIHQSAFAVEYGGEVKNQLPSRLRKHSREIVAA